MVLEVYPKAHDRDLASDLHDNIQSPALSKVQESKTQSYRQSRRVGSREPSAVADGPTAIEALTAGANASIHLIFDLSFNSFCLYPSPENECAITVNMRGAM